MDFNIVEHLLGMALLGAEWVLWLLLFLSVLSVTVMIERIIFYIRIKLNYSEFSEELSRKLLANDLDGVEKLCSEKPAFETQLALKALEFKDQGASAVDQRAESFISAERSSLDRGLVILGTLGNNAPFIGLFGTVIGIIQAFADLKADPTGGPQLIMGAISEALVATAVGLMVAIPAVVAYNLFLRVVKRKLANAESVRKMLVDHFS